MVYVVSKASQSVQYVNWKKDKSGSNSVERNVVIKGGAFVLDRKTMETPAGAITEISDEDLAYLEENITFQENLQDGWVKVFKDLKSAEKWCNLIPTDEAGEEIKDKGSQKTDEDYLKEGQTPPKMNIEANEEFGTTASKPVKSKK